MREENWPGGQPPLDRHFRSSLAWRLCLVAEGRFDTMVTFRRSFEWDIAAGALIAVEAGAEVTDGQGRPMIFNSPDGMQDGVVAAPPLLHREIMRHRAPRGAAAAD
jgi:myo-inositol-1(or 4)-monophosphatase